jgi:hypothetical protein
MKSPTPIPDREDFCFVALARQNSIARTVMSLLLQDAGFQMEKVRSDLDAIQFIQHFVASAFVKIVAQILSRVPRFSLPGSGIHAALKF